MEAIKDFLSQTSFLVAFVSVPGLDASPPASTHELTIPNDVSTFFQRRDSCNIYHYNKLYRFLSLHFIIFDNGNDPPNMK